MKRLIATFAAFLCAPLVPAVIFAFRETGWGSAGVGPLSFWFMVAYLMIGLYVILLGVPAFIVAGRFDLVNVWSIVGTGLVVAGALSFASLHGGVSLESATYRFMSNGPIAVVSALVFWGIWRAGRQSRE